MFLLGAGSGEETAERGSSVEIEPLVELVDAPPGGTEPAEEAAKADPALVLPQSPDNPDDAGTASERPPEASALIPQPMQPLQPIQPVQAESPIAAENSASAAPPPPIMSSRRRFQFSADVSAIYDDNIFFSSTNPTSDFIFVASPKLSLGLGDFRAREETYCILNYNPEAIFFTDNHDETSLDHNAKVEIQYAIARLAVGLEAEYHHLSGATPDLGDRVNRDEAKARLRLAYGWGASWEAETNVLWTGVNYEPGALSDFSEYVNETFLRYQLTARTKAALGVAIGRLEVDGYGDQSFERALLQVISDVGSKLTLKFKGGVEFRQTEYADYSSPVFSLGLDYRLRETTTLGLNAYREVQASGGSPGENVIRTGLVARLRQRLGQRFVAGLDVGYEQLGYRQAGKPKENAKPTGRNDDYFYIRPSLTYELREDRRLELYYLHRENDSSESDASFAGNQAGLSFGMDF